MVRRHIILLMSLVVVNCHISIRSSHDLLMAKVTLVAATMLPRVG
jgi:hypothetical protein